MTTRQIEVDVDRARSSAVEASDAARATTSAAVKTSQRSFDALTSAASEATHAAIGAIDLAVARARGRSDAAFVPDGGSLRQRVRTGVDRLSTRGRRVTGRIRRQGADRVSDVEASVEDLVEEARDRGEDAVEDAGARARETARSTRRTVSAVAPDRDDSLHHPGLPYEERTVEELRQLAAERDVEGRSSMSKSDLITALRA